MRSQDYYFMVPGVDFQLTDEQLKGLPALIEKLKTLNVERVNLELKVVGIIQDLKHAGILTWFNYTDHELKDYIVNTFLEVNSELSDELKNHARELFEYWFVEEFNNN